MATFEIESLTFTYPGRDKPALRDIDLTVKEGEFIALCGQSGCGKTSLLRSLKTVLAPHGERSGSVRFYGRELDTVSEREQAARIGYVLQNPDNQIVTDKVWHELAFGPENLGWDSRTIRVRVAEMASFFGIQTWFDKNVNELSGGEKQMLNLASVMVMKPDLLVLDEPTAQLDPIAAGEFFDTVKKVNREIGTTVIMSEHRLEDLLSLAERVLVMDFGEIIIDETPANAGALLAKGRHNMFAAMPTPLQAYSLMYARGIGPDLACPLDVGQGRRWLTELMAEHVPAPAELKITELPEHSTDTNTRIQTPAVEIKDAWFRYEKKGEDIIKDLSLKVYPGECFAIVGGNGTGKTTTLSLISGINKAYRGKIKINGKKIEDYKSNELFKGMLGVLPQNPQSIFAHETVGEDLEEMLAGRNQSVEEIKARVREVAELVEIEELLESHPYDISGGEQQRAALAKILLLNPKLIMLDEPTKGIDNFFKDKLAKILRSLMDEGATVIMVSHDIEFCAKYADRCAMFFDGSITTTNTPRRFFAGNHFYTTAGNKMSGHIFKNAITAKDIEKLVMKNLE